MLLAGDIGGTKTVLAIYESKHKIQHALMQERFASDDYDSLEEVVADFLGRCPYPVTQAAFGVAGPVVKGQAQITNLPWKISEEALSGRFGWGDVWLLNDLEAVAVAIPHLADQYLETINAGKVDERGPAAVIAPGTGLGEAYLVWDGAGYRAFPSEGGHRDFGPNSVIQWDLLRFMREELGYIHVSYENVCSGIGIPNIYAYLRHIGVAEEPAWLARKLAEAEDQTPIIIGYAQNEDRPVELCLETLRLFVAILGAEAGNLALTLLTTGGVFLGGGIPPRILPQLHDGTFMEAFTNKGRFRSLVSDVPVKIILHPEAALFGAAASFINPKHQVDNRV